MKKVVLKLDYTDEKMKAKAMQKVSGIHGLESIALDAKDKKLTVIGDIDPVSVVGKLRKICRHTEILSVGPAKEPEKKKEEPKKEEPKKEEPKKAEEKKPDAPKPDQAQLLKAYQAHLLQQQQQQQLQLLHQQQMYQYNQQRQHFQQSQAPNPTNYFNRSVEEDPNGCVIC